MKKVGLITYHHSRYSYGASLQALATLRVIEKLGHTAEMINYDNAYEQAEVKPELSFLHRLMSYCKLAVRLYLLKGVKSPYRNSAVLDKIYKNVSTKHYCSVKEMADISYDVILVGSDQVWNRYISHELDDAFLLKFGRAYNKMSYASSMGSVTLTEDEKERFKSAFKDFSHISVREEFAARQLQPLTDKPIRVVLDPTMLLTADEWRSLFKNEHAIQKRAKKVHGYALVYMIGNSDVEWEKCKNYSRIANLPIWNIQYDSLHRKTGIKKVVYAFSLGEFIDMVDNADLIITNSFHGTAFSVMFQKIFVTVLSNNPERAKSLLKQIGLEDRIEIAPERVMEPINYLPINKELEKLRVESLNWLKDAIEDNHG